MALTSVARNVVANFAGKAWTSVMGLVFVPVYVRLMGIESYGLIGVFVSLAALISFLDLGLSSTLSRELARLSVAPTPETARESHDLVRTLEVIYWAAGVVIGVILVGIAPLVARHWLAPSGIPAATVTKAIAIMGLVLAVQWPASLYDGGLTGLQRQVLLNGLRAGIATAQHAGAVLVLWLVSPTILAYFTWQIFVNVAATVLLRRYTWRALPASDAPGAFRMVVLRRHWRFAAGMTGISVLSIVLTQADKIILSKLLPLVAFGYYVLAWNLASILVQVVSPLFSALFPRFTQLFTVHDEAGLPALYHSSCQSVSVLVIPAAAVLMLFPQELLLLWMRDPVIATNVGPILRILIVGQLFNALVFIPYMAQLAYGWTRLVLYANAATVAVIVPLLLVIVPPYGAVGGAIAWIILNGGYVVIMIPIMHRRILRGQMWRWYWLDVGVPLVVALAVVALSRLGYPSGLSQGQSFLWIAASGVVAVAAAALALPFPRTWLGQQFGRLSAAPGP